MLPGATADVAAQYSAVPINLEPCVRLWELCYRFLNKLLIHNLVYKNEKCRFLGLFFLEYGQKKHAIMLTMYIVCHFFLM